MRETLPLPSHTAVFDLINLKEWSSAAAAGDGAGHYTMTCLLNAHKERAHKFLSRHELTTTTTTSYSDTVTLTGGSVRLKKKAGSV